MVNVQCATIELWDVRGRLLSAKEAYELTLAS